jgi:hypothetical protein
MNFYFAIVSGFINNLNNAQAGRLRYCQLQRQEAYKAFLKGPKLLPIRA